MEFFSLFSTVFFNIAITFGFLLLIYLFFFPTRARKDLKPVKYISYKKDHFQEDFELPVSFADPRYLLRMKNVQPVAVILERTRSIS
mgnify:FL=1